MRYVIILAGVLLAAGCSAGQAEQPLAAAPSSPAVDGYARAMCATLKEARLFQEQARGETPVNGYGGTLSEIKANGSLLRAQQHALQSSVPELKEVALSGKGAADLAPALQAWCDKTGAGQ